MRKLRLTKEDSTALLCAVLAWLCLAGVYATGYYAGKTAAHADQILKGGQK